MRRLVRLQLLPATGLVLTRAMPQGLSSRPHHVLGVLFLAMVCAYALSPFMALWSINGALRSHDAGTLAEHIDWSALTSSMKQQTISAINGPPAAPDDLPDFGSSFASNAISNAVDARLTPDSLLNLAAQMMPPSDTAISWGDIYSRLSAHFVSLTQFDARLNVPGSRTSTIVHLKFEHWHWKVTRLDLPLGA